MPRSYDSSRRRAHAELTRRSILDTAQRRFERDGYVATTMEAIAAEAGVSLKTVYLAFSTKAGLLRAVWDLLLKGDTSAAPVAERPWYLEVLDEADPDRKLRLVAHHSVAVKQRIGPLLPSSAAPPPSTATGPLSGSSSRPTSMPTSRRSSSPSPARVGSAPISPSSRRRTSSGPSTTRTSGSSSSTAAWTPEAFEDWFADTLVQQLHG